MQNQECQSIQINGSISGFMEEGDRNREKGVSWPDPVDSMLFHTDSATLMLTPIICYAIPSKICCRNWKSMALPLIGVYSSFKGPHVGSSGKSLCRIWLPESKIFRYIYSETVRYSDQGILGWMLFFVSHWMHTPRVQGSLPFLFSLNFFFHILSRIA